MNEEQKQELADRSGKAADEILARLPEDSPIPSVVDKTLNQHIRTLLMMAWLEGRQAGGDEAKEVIRTFARKEFGDG